MTKLVTKSVTASAPDFFERNVTDSSRNIYLTNDPSLSTSSKRKSVIEKVLVILELPFFVKKMNDSSSNGGAFVLKTKNVFTHNFMTLNYTI